MDCWWKKNSSDLYGQYFQLHYVLACYEWPKSLLAITTYIPCQHHLNFLR